MKTYEFTLTFRLMEGDRNPDRIVERLASAGCDDAMVGTGNPARVSLQFNRLANSAQEAIETAITNVATDSRRNTDSGDPCQTMGRADPRRHKFRQTRQNRR